MDSSSLFTIHKTLSEPGLFTLNKDREPEQAPCETISQLPESGLKESDEPAFQLTKLRKRKIDQTELINAITMMGPSLVTLAYLPYVPTFDTYALLVFTHCFVHMPFSMIHHTNMGLGDPNEGQAGLGLIFRRLDYSFIHVACILLSFGLSRSNNFGMLSIFINGWFIMKIWHYDVKKSGPQEPPVTGVALTVTLYIFSMLIHGQYIDFILSAVMMGLALLVFKVNLLGEHSHPAMHVCLALPQFFFLSHAVQLNHW